MGGGSRLLSLYNSSHAYQMKRLIDCIPTSIMRYSTSSDSEGKKFHRGGGDEEEQHDVREERAPSTAQEFIKVAAEKNIRQGNSPPSRRTRDDEEETTTTSDSDSDSDEDHPLPPPSSIGPTS